MDEHTPPIDDTAPARWTRMASLGLLFAGLAPLLIFLAGLIWGMDMSEDAGFFLITAGIALIASFLVRRFGSWSKVVGIVASILLLGALFWTAFGLFAPAAFFDFVPGVLLVPGALTGLVCSIAALVAGRRGHRTAAAEGGEARGIRILVAGVVVLAVLSAVLTFVGRPNADDAGDATEIALTDFAFDQDEYRVAGGSQVYVQNEDPFLHTFTIDELGVDESLNTVGAKLVDIPDEPGTYVVYCRPHTMDPEDPGEDDMAATITVE